MLRLLFILVIVGYLKFSINTLSTTCFAAARFLFGSRLPFSDDRYLEIRDPERGDVIVFKFPSYTTMEQFRQRNPEVPEPIDKLWLDTVRSNHRGEVDFIKRIVAIPGDTVVVKNKQLFVNGKLVQMPEAVFKDSNTYPSPRDLIGPITVPEDSYFVMGDNRD